jgi:hypothetical protein
LLLEPKTYAQNGYGSRPPSPTALHLENIQPQKAAQQHPRIWIRRIEVPIKREVPRTEEASGNQAKERGPGFTPHRQEDHQPGTQCAGHGCESDGCRALPKEGNRIRGNDREQGIVG